MDEHVETPSESGVEISILNWLDNAGWEVYGHDNKEGAQVLDSEYERERSEVIYWDILKEKVIELNPEIDDENVSSFISSLKRDLSHDNLMDANREFHNLLRKGKKFTVTYEDGTNEAVYIQLIDFDEIEKNRFTAVNQFRVNRQHSIRPDINLFVNGIPLVTGELKSLAQSNNYQDAISDLHEYEDKVSRLFVPSLFNFATDTMEYRYGSIRAPEDFYHPWNEAPEKYQDENQMKQAVQAMLNPETVIDILDNFVFYEKKAGGDAKIVPRYMQYYAANSIFDRIEEGEHDKGLIWHTQGSGKSYTMLYTAWNLLTRNILSNPQVLLIVDTDKLRTQMSNTLSNIGFEHYEVADSMEHLQEMIEQGTSKLILTTIHMFEDVDPESQGNPETVVMSDEAHRFMEKDLGTKLEGALPNSYHFGFTGTPVRENERDTFANFCPEEELEQEEPYLHRYSIRQGIQDELILPVHFDIRHVMDWDIDEATLDIEFEQSFNDLPIEDKKEIIKKYVTQTEISELRPRVETIAQDIVNHYETKIEKNGWNGMVVTPSRKAAALYGEELLKLRDPEEIEVLITARGSDEQLLQKFHTNSEERESIVKRFKDEEEENPKILVVCDMLLTGFDAPILKAMYLDRNLKNHSLLQAIARTNRPAKGKNNGLIVDYAGVFENIDDALDYSKEVQEYAARDDDNLLDEFESLLEDMMEIFEGIPKNNSQETVAKCIGRIEKQPNQRKFKQGFKKLQDHYESISPDGRLQTRGLLEDYKWLNHIYIAYERNQTREEDPEEGLREKTKEIIEDNVEVKEIKDNFPIYELSEEHLEAIQDLEPAAQATEIAHATQEHLQPRVNKNPRYKRLSERVNEIVNDWQTGKLDDPDAVDKLERVENEVIELEEEADSNRMNPAEYAIYLALTSDEYSDYIEDDEEAREIARSVVDRFEDQIDRSFENWESNDQTKKKIRRLLIGTIVKDYDKKGLYKADGFLEDVQEYLVRNYE